MASPPLPPSYLFHSYFPPREKKQVNSLLLLLLYAIKKSSIAKTKQQHAGTPAPDPLLFSCMCRSCGKTRISLSSDIPPRTGQHIQLAIQCIWRTYAQQHLIIRGKHRKKRRGNKNGRKCQERLRMIHLLTTTQRTHTARHVSSSNNNDPANQR